MTFNNSSPHRQSVRLPDFDYSQPGAYFVTIVTQDRKMLFGQIVGGEMELNDIGRMVRAAWIAIPEHYPMVELGEFVIMPNHFHGIIAICVGARQCAASPCGTPCLRRLEQQKGLDTLFQVLFRRSCAPSNQRRPKRSMNSPGIQKIVFGSGVSMSM